MSKLIYLATPYSHEDPLVRLARYEIAVEATSTLFRKGFFVYSPIVHGHPITVKGFGHQFTDWAQWNELMIWRSDQMVVVQMLGWETSKGIAAEVKIAERLGKPVYYASLMDINSDPVKFSFSFPIYREGV